MCPSNLLIEMEELALLDARQEMMNLKASWMVGQVRSRTFEDADEKDGPTIVIAHRHRLTLSTRL